MSSGDTTSSRSIGWAKPGGRSQSRACRRFVSKNSGAPSRAGAPAGSIEFSLTTPLAAAKRALSVNVRDMARSPLMRALQRLAREHAEASWRGVDVSKVREERAAAFLERRRFLQGAGATAGAAFTFRTRLAKADAQGAAKKPKIVIVGAGIAGLNGALTLRDAGFDATVYE